MLQAVRMGQEHHADGECTQTILPLVDHDLASTANRATAMLEAELGGDHEDVGMTLLLAQFPHGCLGARRLTQTFGTELTVTVVIELAVAVLLDQAENTNDVVVVVAGKYRFGTPDIRQCELALGTVRHVASKVPDSRIVAQFGEQLLQHLHLIMNQGGLVAREIAVVAGDFLVLVLVGRPMLSDELSNHVRQTGGVVDTLSLDFGETSFVIGGFHDGNELATL